MGFKGLMLGRTANNLFWMFRYLERSENTARLIDAGFRITLTRSDLLDDEWASVIDTVRAREAYEARHEDYRGSQVIDFLLRDTSNPGSVINMMERARENARAARTALTRQVWEAVNESWLRISDAFKKPISAKGMPDLLSLIREQSALVHGAFVGTMLRNDVYNFASLGIFVERADNTARIMDVKYYVLLPSVSLNGTKVDNIQWESILRSVSALRSFRWLKRNDVSPARIAEYLVLDPRLPRSLLFCASETARHLIDLNTEYAVTTPSAELASSRLKHITTQTIEEIFETGLHEFISSFIQSNNQLAAQIETDYRFTD